MLILILFLVVFACVVFLALRRSEHHPKPEITVNGRKYTFDPQDGIDIDKELREAKKEYEEIHAQNVEWERQAKELYKYQNAGIEAEKMKDIPQAVCSYEKAVEYGRSASKMKSGQYYYSIERLLVLYRKKKEYDKEISLIRSALNESISDRDRADLQYRLERATILQNKSKQ